MTNNKDILNNEELRQNPFTVPEGYFTSLEDQLREKVLGTQRRPAGFVGVLKPALMLMCSFAVIIGLGYGVLSLTDTIGRGQTQLSAYDAVADAVENFDPAMFEYLDQYDLDGYMAQFTPSEEDIMNYFGTSSTDVALYNYLASLE